VLPARGQSRDKRCSPMAGSYKDHAVSVGCSSAMSKSSESSSIEQQGPRRKRPYTYRTLKR